MLPSCQLLFIAEQHPCDMFHQQWFPVYIKALKECLSGDCTFVPDLHGLSVTEQIITTIIIVIRIIKRRNRIIIKLFFKIQTIEEVKSMTSCVCFFMFVSCSSWKWTIVHSLRASEGCGMKSESDAFRARGKRLRPRGIFWNRTVIVFSKRFVFNPGCLPLPAFLPAYSLFVILFVGRRNQMKCKYSWKTTVIVRDHWIESSSMRLKAEWLKVLLFFGWGGVAFWEPASFICHSLFFLRKWKWLIIVRRKAVGSVNQIRSLAFCEKLHLFG